MQRNCDTVQLKSMKEMSVTITVCVWWSQASFIAQDLVEKVVVLQRAVELTQKSGPAAIGILLAEKMSHYANLLASQGSLSTAIKYLPDNSNQVGYTSEAPTVKNKLKG